MNRTFFVFFALVAVGCDEGTPHQHAGDTALFVASEGSLGCWAVEDGSQHPGEVQSVTGPVDLQVLADETVMLNLTGRNEILAVDGKTMLEKARIPSSGMGAVRPVHSFVTPERNGKAYWMTLNDGAMNKVETNSARFVDITPGSATYLQPVGEVRLGVGHHKASFSSTRERVVISNISDCDNVISVYDYSDIANIKTVATLTAAQAGFDGSTRAKTCDPTYQNGQPPSPHGCATSSVTGKVFCNMTATGEIIVVDVDATPPTFTLVPTGGAGGGYTKAHPAGRYLYSLQEEPREGSAERPGAPCQIGQLVVIDAMTESIAKELPLFYKGPGCTEVLAGTAAETANPGHIAIAADKLFAVTSGGFMVDDARVDQLLVLDLSDPASPAQRPSVKVGAGTGHGTDALSGDGKWLFVNDAVDGTVSQIDTATGTLVKSIAVKANPRTLGTFGPEGPSHHAGH